MKKLKDGDRVDKDTLGKYHRGKQNRFKVSCYKLKSGNRSFGPGYLAPYFRAIERASKCNIAHSISQ